MLFKKKQDKDFELKTEEYEQNDNFDKDFFRYEDETNYNENNSESYKAQTIIDNDYFDENNQNSYEDDKYEDLNDNYNDEIDSYYDENNKTDKQKQILYILNKIASILLGITIFCAIMILFDVILLTRFQKGPIFAIKTKTYNDGGTKVYYGMGYKVIKYNITDGRHDMVVGNYSITYSKKSK